ncbi:MAG: thioredoxin domain-containing protein [Vicinamibacterales bacterium]
MANRLAHERSPYLLQHADNPVDWWPWSDAAFAYAREVDKPIFLSIGYSTCHWCHVMAHESFEDPTIAAVLNRDFVPIKLDREERPDVDRVYMTFVQATTGAGGWPMSVFLTPDLKPFFGGTYFPPTTRWGRPGFIDLLQQLAAGWTSEREKLVESAEEVVARLREVTGADQAATDRAPVARRDAVDVAVEQFSQTFDGRYGGFGGAPKFPRPSELFCLLRAFALTGDPRARQMATETLHAMALGGMRDHVGGGFHRYSVDAQWRVPHFEKMLYDQAQLVIAYLEAAQVTGDPFYAAVAEDTLEYVRRDLTSDEGGFYSAEDADSVPPGEAGDDRGGSGHAGGANGHGHAREGAFYVWTTAELDALLGDDAPVVRRRFGVEDGGNALADPQGEFRGQNLFYVAQEIDDIAKRLERPVEDVMAALTRARQTLFTAREKRPRPHLDDKVLAGWNGLMIAAFARAARVLADSTRRAAWLEAAEKAAGFAKDRLWDESRQRLRRRYREGDAAIDGFCEDYAYLTWGLLELFQATGATRWLEWAETLAERQSEQFYDERDGGWFATSGDDPSVLFRLKEDYDGAEPSAASVTVANLILLGRLTGSSAWTEQAGRSLERYGPGIGQAARVMPFMVGNVACWNARSAQVVVGGGEAKADARRALEREVARHYLPFAAVILRGPDAGLATALPWLEAMAGRDGAPAAYVCADFVCREPVTEPVALATQIEDVSAPRRII